MPRTSVRGRGGGGFTSTYGPNFADVVFSREAPSGAGRGSFRKKLDSARRRGSQSTREKLREEMLRAQIDAFKEQAFPGRGGFGSKKATPDPLDRYARAQANLLTTADPRLAAAYTADPARYNALVGTIRGLGPELTQAGLMQSGKLYAAKKGISRVPETGPAILHEGEAVISAPVVEKVMGADYPKGTSGKRNELKKRDYKDIIMGGMTAYQEGTGDKKKQEDILTSVIDELFKKMGVFPTAEGPSPEQYLPGLTPESPGAGQLEVDPFEQYPVQMPEEEMGLPGPPAAPAPESQFGAGGLEAAGPDAGVLSQIEELAGPERSPADVGREAAGGTPTGYGDIRESVGEAGERKFTTTGEPPPPPTAMDIQKEQLDRLLEQAQSMYTSAVTLASYANERPNSPAAQYLMAQSQERMKASKQLQAMYQQGATSLQQAEAQQAETEALETAAIADAQAAAQGARYTAEGKVREEDLKGRQESAKNLQGLLKVLAEVSPDRAEEVISQILMFYLSGAGYGDVAQEFAAGG